MNILVICKRHYTGKDLIKDRFGRLFHFPAQWAKGGSNVFVMALDYHTSENFKKNIDGVDFYSIDFAIHRFIKAYKNIKQTASVKNYNFIFASGDQIAGLIGLKLSKQIGCPLIFDMYDDYDVFGMNKIPVMKSILRYVIKNSNYISCTSNPIKVKFSQFNSNIGIHPNGVDKNIFYPMPMKRARETLGLSQEKIYIGYTGTIDGKFDYPNLMKAFEVVRSKIPNAHLLFAGANPNNIKFDVSKITHLGMLEQRKIVNVIAASDVMVMPYADHPQVHKSNPCKLTEYFACQKPVVSANISDVETYFEAPFQSLYLCGSTQDLADKLILQINNQFVENAKDQYCWSNIANSLYKEIKSIISNNSAQQNK